MLTAYARIYRALERIPAGRVATYGTIARLARASGPRQVGYALHAVHAEHLPWFRVVNAQGGISVRGDGAITQRIRLEREGIVFNGAERIDLARFGWPEARPRRRGA